MATPAAEDPWWQLSPEEKKRIVQDTWAAALIDDLDMRDDEDDDTAAFFYGVPASKKAMMDLYTPTWGETAMREDGHAGCAVCLEGLETDQKLRMMPCHHTFHQLCIFKWLYVNRVCPICQFALPSDQEQCLLDQEEEEEACARDAGSCYQPMILD
ncbi:unnamed protein product [Urochloa humidicola]